MPNRFYRPSPTQYTSQFVAEQYPYDAMLALEEKKIGRADAAMSQLGEMDVQFGSLTGGPGTQDMARNIAEKYKGKVGEFLDKKRDIWSTQTIRDLSALRASYTSDPDVKAVLQDQTKGLAQLMQIQASRKGPLDIDPNMDPETGQVRQLQSGQPWRPYQQLNYEIDWRKAATDILQTVDPRQTSVRYGDSMPLPDGTIIPGFSQGTKTDLGEKEFEPTINILTDTVLEGKEGWTNWYMREARKRLGRDPTRKEIYQDMKGLSTPLYDEDDNIRFQQATGVGRGKDDEGSMSARETTTRPHEKSSRAATVDIAKPQLSDEGNLKKYLYNIAANIIPGVKRKPYSEAVQDKSFSNAAAALALADESVNWSDPKEARKAVENYQGEFISRGEADVLVPFGPEEREFYQGHYGGEETAQGYIKNTTAPAFLTDSRIVNLSDPKTNEVKQSERTKFFKEGNTWVMKGTLTPNKNNAGPGYIYFTVFGGPKDKEGTDYAVSPDDETADRHRLAWNLNAHSRNSSFNTQDDDDIDKVDSFRYYGTDQRGAPMIVDKENKGRIDYQGPYHTLVPRRDFEDKNRDGNKSVPGRYVIDVYKNNPSGDSFVKEFSVAPNLYTTYDGDIVTFGQDGSPYTKGPDGQYAPVNPSEVVTPIQAAWIRFETEWPELMRELNKNE